MPRRPDDIPVQVPFSPDQKVLLDKLANGLSVNRYIRELIAADAEARGLEWPDVKRKKWTPLEK